MIGPQQWPDSNNSRASICSLAYSSSIVKCWISCWSAPVQFNCRLHYFLAQSLGQTVYSSGNNKSLCFLCATHVCLCVIAQEAERIYQLFLLQRKRVMCVISQDWSPTCVCKPSQQYPVLLNNHPLVLSWLTLNSENEWFHFLLDLHIGLPVFGCHLVFFFSTTKLAGLHWSLLPS